MLSWGIMHQMKMKRHSAFLEVIACAMCAVSLLPDALARTVFVQDREVFVRDANYDKDKIPPYTLEDPLSFSDGRKVSAASGWISRLLWNEMKRRGESSEK